MKKRPLLVEFDHFLDSRAEIHQIVFVAFMEN